MNWIEIAEKSCRENGQLSVEEACAVLNCPDESLLSLVDAAFFVRHKYFGKKVKMNYLLDVKSGYCSEDCSYCSQSKISKAKIYKHPFLSADKIISAAQRAVTLKAKRFCMVNSGRAPSEKEVEWISWTVEQIKQKFPRLEICVCLGILNEPQAEKLKQSGVDAYNHNLNTSKNYYPKTCTTHNYDDRAKTLAVVKKAGLLSCSGCLFGMGEENQDIIDLAFSLREVGVDSIPLNFLIPIPGTPFETLNVLTPQKCLKIICLFRFTNPKSEIRIAGGREVHLRWLQPLGLYAANSIFIGDYLTTKGQKPEKDIAMIKDMGFEIDADHETEMNTNKIAVTSDEFAVKLK